MSEKVLFLVIASCASYLSFEHLFLESGLSSKTDFEGWGDFLGGIGGAGNSITLMVYSGMFVLAFLSIILTLRNVIKKD